MVGRAAGRRKQSRRSNIAIGGSVRRDVERRRETALLEIVECGASIARRGREASHQRTTLTALNDACR